MGLRDRRRSRAENNFQLRVRKRATPMAESNFQLRVRKDILNRIRSVPQIRSAAENNFKLRVRKAGSAERNFQLRVRRSGNEENQPDMDYVIEPDYFNRHVRQTLLDQIRDRRNWKITLSFGFYNQKTPKIGTIYIVWFLCIV